MTDIDSFRNARVLVVGDLMLDRYCWGSVTRISPEAPVPVVRLERETTRPGGAANVAANVVSLGAKVKLIGPVGGDQAADQLMDSLKSCNVSDLSFITTPRRKTIVKTRIMAHGQQIVRLDSEDTDPIPASEVHQIVEQVTEGLTAADAVILSDYGKGSLCDAVVTKIIKVCRSMSKPVLADPKGKDFGKYAGVTVLTPNRREAAEACKLEESDPDLVRKAGEALLGGERFDAVLITESENGMTVFSHGHDPIHFDASAREVYDVTGAGDTVIACLGVGLAAGLRTDEAAMIANVAAGISVQHLGTVGVSFDELCAELSQIRQGSRHSTVG